MQTTAPFNIPCPTIVEVFRNNHPFYVPKYQRGYAWEEDEISDFITDIKELLDQTNPSKPHFMGGLVHVAIPTTNIVSRKHEIVDGQQRMATFSLTISAILSGLNILISASTDSTIKEFYNGYSDEIREAFLVYNDMSDTGRVEEPKLRLSRTDETFFRALVNGTDASPSRESHRLLQKAYNTIYRELIAPIIENADTVKDKLKDLINLYKTISDRCIVIYITSEDRREAYRLFSILNDRGRNLTDGDLLRASTLEILEGNTAVQNEVEQLWDDILDGKAEDIARYLKAYFPSVTGERAPNKDLFDTYEKEFLQNPTHTSTRDFVFALHQDKPVFDAIRQGEWPFPNNSTASAWERDRLNRLVNVLRHEAAHPLLLSAVKLGEKKFTAVVQLLERFVFRYITIVKAHPSPLYKPYNDTAKKMRERTQTYEVRSLKAKLVKLIQDRASDNSFQSNLLTKLEYSDNTARNREIRHFFSTLESYRSWYQRGARRQPRPDTMMVFEMNEITIEHIYPDNAEAADQDIQMEPLKQKLANLTIMNVSDNSALGNSNFSIKKVEYKKSNVGLTQRLSLFQNWTPTEFETREKELVQMALAVFKIT